MHLTEDEMEFIKLEVSTLDEEELFDNYLFEKHKHVYVAGYWIADSPGDVIKMIDRDLYDRELNGFLNELIEEGKLIKIGWRIYDAEVIHQHLEEREL